MPIFCDTGARWQRPRVLAINLVQSSETIAPDFAHLLAIVIYELMLNQSFTATNFLRLLRKQDIYDYKMGKSTDDYLSKLVEVEISIADKAFKFSEFRRFDMPHGIAYAPNCLTDEFSLRKLNDNIKRSFNIKLIDRNRIIPQVKYY